MRKDVFSVALSLVWVVAGIAVGQPIDREALVRRHNPVVTAIDTLASLSVGNGRFAFTADVTGLQTFPEYYAGGVPLGTQSQWGWHSFDNPENLRIEESYVSFDFGRGHPELYATQPSGGRPKAAAEWYRQNPHRLHLGCVGLEIEGLTPYDIHHARQTLDLWTGIIHSQFTIDNSQSQSGNFSVIDLDNPSTFNTQHSQFTITTACHPQRDMVGSIVECSGKRTACAVNLRFPYPTGGHSDDGCNWQADDRHSTELVSLSDHQAVLRRTIDTSTYYVVVCWEGKASIMEKRRNYWVLQADTNRLAFTCEYLPEAPSSRCCQSPISSLPSCSAAHWQRFWQEGAAVDFSHCKDSRAQELERRVVLSQYLLAIQCCGDMPPQETGLTYNSWFGKFHLEMIWWHQAWLPLWQHAEQLERTLAWYPTVKTKAQEIARRQGFRGLRWMKMTDPSGEEAPSKVGSFLIWQQPHLIYLAELLYRCRPRQELLDAYGQLIDETATFMADFVTYDASSDRYILKGMIPAQETLKPDMTVNAPFELAYWHWALGVAQQWRERRGMERVALWDDIIGKLSPLAENNGLYLAAESAPDTYRTPALISDHPAVLGALGIFPQSRLVEGQTMRSTLEWIWENWNWDHTWGWDYPMVAMNAARLGCQERAVDALLMDKRTNTFLTNGHNYQDQRLRCYLPGNGGLLTAIAMMCAGWDGSTGKNPGFPNDGQWDVCWEGLQQLP